MKIDWSYPEPRSGFLGFIDKFIGPGPTTAEKRLQLFAPIVAAFALAAHGFNADYGWSVGQYVVAIILAVDMVGGIATNATSTAKRWFFREGEGFKAHMSFIALHLLQITLASYFFLDFDIQWIVVVFSYLMVTCAFILIVPLYLQRPVAMLVCAASMVLSIYVFKSPAHLEWLLPLFFIKLQICHVLREEPYRPETEEAA